ncbi:POTRA domain-containing protein [Sediminispirochaeta bajacaliforniensis]|uniref:POTRA domain-containing protein n=1 Tax=Sediminispirochaeta bajacaliforniensis TaxID=148 RepID=UPI00036D2E6F|nr:POTRA domain-containing protein [Sediminispirochaeta bajacaliforniensis]
MKPLYEPKALHKTIQTRRLCLILLLGFFSSGSLWPLENVNEIQAATESDTIVKVTYKGLKRTKEETIKDITGIGIGQTIDTINTKGIEQKLMGSGLFSEVSVSINHITNTEYELVIIVSEKLTLVPIPFLYFSDSSMVVGGMLFDSNLFGKAKNFVAGGLFSETEKTAFANFIDPHYFNRTLLVALSGFVSTNDNKEFTYVDDDSFADYDSIEASGGISLSYRRNQWFIPTIDVTTAYYHAANFDDIPGVEDELFMIAPGVSITFHNMKHGGSSPTGISVSIAYHHGFSIVGSEEYDSITMHTNWSTTLLDDNKFQLGLSGEYSDRSLQVMDNLSEKGRGYQILPKDVYASKYAAGYGAYSIPVIKAAWGTLETDFLYEFGFLEAGLKGSSQSEYYHGPGYSFNLHLNKVAIPAIGMCFAYNIRTETPVMSFSLGFSM